MAINSHLNIDKVGLDLITQFEGCKLKPYNDVAGLKTIGVGHLIKPGENFDSGITKEKAMDLLKADCQDVVMAIHKNVSYPLNQNQFNALCSFLFNLGVAWIKKGSVKEGLDAGKPDMVVEGFLKFSKARIGGELKTVPGLLKRRQAEADLFMKPVVATSAKA